MVTLRPLRQLTVLAAVLAWAACASGDEASSPSPVAPPPVTPPPPGPGPSGRVLASAQAPVGPLYVGESVIFSFSGTAVEGATVDSVVVPLGVPRVLGPAGTSLIEVLEGPRAVLFTVWGRNSASRPISAQATVAYTGVRRPSAVRLMIRPLGAGTAFAGSLSRVDVVVNGQLLNVPTDTTIERTGPTFTLGVPATQPAAYTYGELVLDTLWRPLAPNLRTHTLPLSGDVAVELALLSKAGIGAADKAEFDQIWRNPWDSTLHPTRLRHFVVVVPDTGLQLPGASAKFFQTMTAADSVGLHQALDSLRAEDGRGPDGARRTYAIQHVLDPLAAGLIVLHTNGLYRPVPGVLVVGRSAPGAQGNIQHYDSQGYLDGAFVRASGTAGGWMSELKGFSDMVYRGQEGESSTASRHSRLAGSITRKSLDTFVYDHIMRIAWRAGQHGFGLQRGPQ